MSLNAAKCHGYSFYHFRVIKGKPIGEGLNYLPPTQIRLKKDTLAQVFACEFCEIFKKIKHLRMTASENKKLLLENRVIYDKLVISSAKSVFHTVISLLHIAISVISVKK